MQTEMDKKALHYLSNISYPKLYPSIKEVASPMQFEENRFEIFATAGQQLPTLNALGLVSYKFPALNWLTFNV